MQTKRQIILDTETTGLEPSKGHRIIEIGCIELIDRELTGNNYHSYINPERNIDPGAQAVHGITLDSLRDKPTFIEIVIEFLEYINGSELIIHNAAFDIGFLNHEFQLAGAKYGKIANYCTVIDTLTMARRLHPGQKNSLDALCKRYGVSNSHRQLHGALLDSEILAQVYLNMTRSQERLELGAFGESELIKSEGALERVDSEGLIVIQATDDELKSHQQRLQEIKNSAGSCMWID